MKEDKTNAGIQKAGSQLAPDVTRKCEEQRRKEKRVSRKAQKKA